MSGFEFKRGINSSKVYCKFLSFNETRVNIICINSSKVYCKSIKPKNFISIRIILIVAKCIVNSCNDSTKQSKLEY